jgi:hypothetical protein
MYADVFLMENCAFLSKFLSRSWHLYFLQAAAQFEQQTIAARARYRASFHNSQSRLAALNSQPPFRINLSAAH